MSKSIKRPKIKIPNTKRPNYDINSEAKKTADIERMGEIIKSSEKINLFDTDNNVFPMLYGYKDAEGVLHKKFEVRDILGSDSEAIHKSDVKSNGARVVTTLLSRCVTKIGTIEAKKVGQAKWLEIIRNLYMGEQDYMMLQLRVYTKGREITVDHICPNKDCKAKLKTVLDVEEIEIKPFVSETVEFELYRGYTDKQGVVHKTGTLRLPCGIDREILMPLAKTNLARAETVMLTRTMKFDDGYPVDDSVTSGLTVKDREYLSELQEQFYFGFNPEIEITCDSCGESFKGTLNASNFI